MHVVILVLNYFSEGGGRKGGTLVHQSKQEFIHPQPTICITPGKQISNLNQGWQSEKPVIRDIFVQILNF